jgi:hypothetical protein
LSRPSDRKFKIGSPRGVAGTMPKRIWLPHPHGRWPKSRESTRPAHRPPPALTPQQQAEAPQRRAEGATLKELARSYDVSQATISRLVA